VNAEIENWLNSPNMAGSFSTGTLTIAKNDSDGLRNNFADIASGRVTVK
jgi:hypothetical protein